MCSGSFGGFLPVKDFRRMERSWALFLLFLFWQQHYILGGINKWMMVNFHFILPEPKISIWWIYSCCTCIYYRLVFHISYACSQGHKENSCWERVVGFLSFEPLFLCFDSSYEHPRPSYSPQQPVCAHADQWPFTLRPLDDFCNVSPMRFSFIWYFWPLFLCFLSSCSSSSIFFCLSTA